jgi:integrase
MLTAKTVENAKAGTTRYEIWDKGQPGLGLRVTEKGVKTWVVVYRVGGKQRRLTLGRYPAVGLKEARQAAREALLQVQAGIDPVAQQQEVETQAAVERADTFGHLAARYLSEHVARKALRWADLERILNRDVLPFIGDKPLNALTKRDVQRVIDPIAARGAGVQANKTLEVLSRIFNWAIKRDLIDVSPTRNVEPPGVETDRARWLDEAEIRKVWRACDSMQYPFGPVVKLLLLTGQRRDEVGGLSWSEIDMEGATWTLPAERSKNGKEHEVHLSPLALDVLAGLPRFSTGDFVFTTTGKAPASGYSMAKRRLDATILKQDREAAALAGLDPDKVKPMPAWVLHDLRRTTVSHAARLGVAPHIADKILNHQSGTIKGVAAVYQRHAFLTERRDALNLWARFVESVIKPAPGNVVMLRTGSRL